MLKCHKFHSDFTTTFYVVILIEGLADAPSTIRDREELQRMQRENIFYTPTAGEVPEIAVPDFLPDLLGRCSWSATGPNSLGGFFQKKLNLLVI